MKRKFTNKNKRWSKWIQAVVMILFFAVLLLPHFAFASPSNGDGSNGNGAEGDARGEGATGSVPVNTDICLLAAAGVAYCAKKFYDLKQQGLPVVC